MQTRIFYRIPLKEFPLDAESCELVVWRCIDFRFRRGDQQAVERGLEIGDFDLSGWPAPAKVFLTDGALRQEALQKIQVVCQELHGVKKLLILGHWDCGGYGGSREFASVDHEEVHYQEDLARARQWLQRSLSAIEVMAGYSKTNPGTGMMEYHLLAAGETPAMA